MIGVGVTEAGLASPSSRALVDLTDVLFRCYKNMQLSKLQCLNPNGRICVINTDNLPNNGNVIRSHVLEIASALDGELGTAFFKSLRDNAFASFHNTMVDRITSHREGTDGIMVPRCEPIPSKALVIE